MCAQRILRSAWASAQSDQSLRCAFNGYLRTQAFMRTAKTLIRLGGCPGWSESSLGAHAILLVLSSGGSNQLFTPLFYQQLHVHHVTNFEHSDNAEGMANSVDPDQTAPKQSDLAYTVCPDLFVQKLRIIMVFHRNWPWQFWPMTSDFQ